VNLSRQTPNRDSGAESWCGLSRCHAVTQLSYVHARVCAREGRAEEARNFSIGARVTA
jgi:hypothetical protein